MNFLNETIDRKNLLKDSNMNPFLLENNIEQTEQILDFFKNETKLLLINGFMGTGKVSVLQNSLKFLNSITLWYNCFETTILDDILLTFFDEFKTLIQNGELIKPKIKTENFAQKINAYFVANKKPIVVVINSFEQILKENKTEILDFIKHLCSLDNVKVVLLGRKFDYGEFDLNYEKVTILALEKSIYEKFLRSQDIKLIGPVSDELYKNTRGYFFYVILSIKLMRIKDLSLIQFIDAYTKSFLSFNDFILREALSLIDPVNWHLFRFLTVIRHPVGIKLLKTIHLYNEEKADYFVQNLLLAKTNDSVYLQDYYKIISENLIPQNVYVKIHQACVDLYNTQLPLKPMERDLLLSRQTMRKEIEFHSMFLPRRMQVQAVKIPQKPEKEPEPVKSDEVIEKMSFVFDDEYGLLDKIADSIKDFLNKNEKQVEEDESENKLTLTELMNLAKQEEVNYNYKHAISLYTKALGQKNNEDYYTYLPTIYVKLGFSYQNCSEWFEAQKYFELAEEFYKSSGDIEKIYEMKYNVANIFYQTFKQDKAIELCKIIDEQNISNELRVKNYNLLANLVNDSQKAKEYYELALQVDKLNIDKNILGELYYKYAFLNEESEDLQTALKYYKMCIELKDTEYLSVALANVATLYDELGKAELAIKFYFESFKIDKEKNNFNGLYSTAMKLAEIYCAKDENKALEYYKCALELAKVIKEEYYLVSAYTALGDYYFYRNYNESAYKNYKHAKEACVECPENITKIQYRLDEIKQLVGEERFKELEK